MSDIEFQRRQIEFGAMFIVGALEITRDLGQFFVPLPGFMDHVGDFTLGYMVNWFSNMTMELRPLRKLPEQKRLKISAGLALGTVLALELAPLVYAYITNTPPLLGSEIKDIPAGPAGIIASHGVRRLAQRWVGEQVN